MNYRTFFVPTLLLGLLVVPGVAHGLTGPGTITGIAGGNNLIGAIQAIVGWLLTLAGIVAAVYLIYGGVRYITSAGDEDKAGEAKQTILYALIGLIIIGLAVVIVNFVLSAIPT